MAWIGGVEVFPGLRLVPRSKIYDLKAEYVDAVVTVDGVPVECHLISKYPLGSATCFSLPNLIQHMARNIEQHVGAGVSVTQMAFTGKTYFPRSVFDRTPDGTFKGVIS